VVKPGAGNTGVPAGTSLKTDSSSEIDASNLTLDGRKFTADTVRVYGNNVTITNSQFVGSVVAYGDNFTVSHTTAQGVALSGVAGGLLEYLNISGWDDGIDLFSDTGPVSNITLRYNYIHNPNPPASAHADGTQVRGVTGLAITCSVYDLGAWQTTYNSAIYLENAYQGDTNITLSNNWLNGGGYTISVDATNLTVTNNRFGADDHWGQCDNASNKGGIAAFTSHGNVLDATGQPLNLCGQG
jgi:hypothetical protein